MTTADVSARDCPSSVNHTRTTNWYDRPGDRLYGATYTCKARDDIDDADSTVDATFRVVSLTLLPASSRMLNTDHAADSDDDSGSSALKLRVPNVTVAATLSPDDTSTASCDEPVSAVSDTVRRGMGLGSADGVADGDDDLDDAADDVIVAVVDRECVEVAVAVDDDELEGDAAAVRDCDGVVDGVDSGV